MPGSFFAANVWESNLDSLNARPLMSEPTLALLGPNDDLGPWDEFVLHSPQSCLFSFSWWLRAACGESFAILVAKDRAGIEAGVVLPQYRPTGRADVDQPPITSFTGILLPPRNPAWPYERQLSTDMRLLSALAGAVPICRSARLVCHPTLTNWLPFYWQDWSQTTAYTYRIENLADSARVFAEMDYSKQKNIKKAEKLVEVHEGLSAAEFYANHQLTLRKQGKTITYPAIYLERLFTAAREHNVLSTYHATDKAGNLHSAVFLVHDAASAYYLLSTIDPEFRNSGASTLLVWTAIQRLSQKTRAFDFEGSMVPGIENSFRKFGARQTPYFVITKGNQQMLRLVRLGERLMRRLGLKE